MTSPADRPISPHLSIYRPMLTMVMSILHRITGIALYIGMAGLAAWLTAGAYGPEAFSTAQRIAGSWFGLVVLAGFVWGLTHHLLGGIRHFLWDFGIGMGVETREWLTRGTIIGSVLLTIVILVAATWIGRSGA